MPEPETIEEITEEETGAEEEATPEAPAEGEEEAAPEGGEEGGDEPKETVKIGDTEYEKGTPEYTEALEKAHQDYLSLLPQYTKVTQENATLKEGPKPEEKKEELPDFMKPDWQPKTFEELQSAIKGAAEFGAKTALSTIDSRDQKSQEATKQVNAFIAEVVKVNPDFNENDFYSYVARHKIRVETIEDLKAAHSTYAEVNNKPKPKETVVKKPGSSGAPSGGGEEGATYDSEAIRTGGGNIMDKALKAFKAVSKD